MTTPVLDIDQFNNSKVLNDVYVNSFSQHISLNRDLINKPHSHNFYLCVLFTEGTGTHEIDFNSYAIHPGKVFFLKPGQTHFWKFEKETGFFFGAMFVSYAIAVAEMITSLVIFWSFLDLSPLNVFFIIAFIAILCSSFNFRMSRAIWIYLFY